MPKRKWNRLHDDITIASERDHRSRSLREQQEARVTVDEGLAEREEEPRSEPRTEEPRTEAVRTEPPAEPGPDAAAKRGRRRRG